MTGALKERSTVPTEDELYDLLPDAVEGEPVDLSTIAPFKRRRVVLALLGAACGGRALPPMGRSWTFREIRWDGEWGRLRQIASAVRPNRGSQLWTPEGVDSEYRQLQKRSRTDLLQLVLDVNNQNLRVEGYRRKDATTDADAWQIWVRNRMESRQSGIHRTVLTLGYCYTGVSLDKAGKATFMPWSPLRTYAWFAESGWTDEDPAMSNEWPSLVLRHDRPTSISIYDAHRVWRYEISRYALEGAAAFNIELGQELAPHDLPETLAGVHPPVVRHVGRTDLLGDPIGEVEPLIPVQQRVEETVFSALMAQTYTAFRQRWATGIELPLGPDGQPLRIMIDPHQSILPNTSPDGKFGDFGATDLNSFAAMLDHHTKTGAAIGQLPPQSMLGSMDNVGADGLAAASQGNQRKAGDYRLSIGVGHKQLFREGARAEGDEAAAEDYEAEEVWADTEQRALQSFAQGLAVLKGLNVPEEALWEMLPGVTRPQVIAWKRLRDERDAKDPFKNAMMTELAAGKSPDQPPLPGLDPENPNEPPE